MSLFAKVVIWYGVVFGILDWLSDIIYVSAKEVESTTLLNASRAFIVIQPIWFFFVHFIYMASNQQLEGAKERLLLIALSPVYAILQYLKLLGAFPQVHEWYIRRTGREEKPQVQLLTLENCYKVQVFTEFFLENIPQIIIQVTINNNSIWDGPANFSFAMSILLFIKDVTLITLFFIKKFIDQTQEPLIRPLAEGKVLSKIEMEATNNISNYIIDQKDISMDEEGNTSLHQLTKFDALSDLETQVYQQPHLLFLLNKDGCTPLDLAINEQQYEKAVTLLENMQKLYHCKELKLLRRPNRVDMKFEKAFTLAIIKNDRRVIEAFPDRAIKTGRIYMGKVGDYRRYKEER